MKTSTLSKEQAIAFFEHYGNEFDSANWSSFASHFHEPCLTVRGDGSVKQLQSRSDAAAFFEDVGRTWRHEGYHRFITKNFDVMPMGKYCVLVTFDWEMLNEKGDLLKTWRQSYQLIQTGTDWRVLVSTFHAK